ncbi:MAG: 6,7-dimethyl-8-ribityllumazine synthase [Ferruginibacter sp.]
MALTSSDIINTTGIQIPPGACVVIVRTEWNASIVDLLENGCITVLKEHNINYRIITVPGAFELIFGIKNYWDNHKYKDDKPNAFIALGCVLKGDTPHFEYVCNAATEGIVQLNLSLPIPTIFGVLTVNNQQQADERTGGMNGNKGAESATTALKMIALAQSFKKFI